MGTVPLQDVNLAVKELRRCVLELDLRGVIIGSVVEGIELGDKKLWKFWKELQTLDVPCFIHPDGFTHPQRLGKYYMWNTIAQPLEEALAMSSFVYEGVMDAFPRLKILICHGGGYLPFYNGRADMGYIARPETRGKARHKPSDYFKRFFYDSVFYDDRMLMETRVRRLMTAIAHAETPRTRTLRVVSRAAASPSPRRSRTACSPSPTTRTARNTPSAPAAPSAPTGCGNGCARRTGGCPRNRRRSRHRRRQCWWFRPAAPNG